VQDREKFVRGFRGFAQIEGKSVSLCESLIDLIRAIRPEMIRQSAETGQMTAIGRKRDKDHSPSADFSCYTSPMHELGVTRNLLDLALQHATAAGAVRVTALHLTVGRLSGIIDDSIALYWQLLTRDTLCAGSTLHFTHPDATWECTACGHTWRMNQQLTPCPACDSIAVCLTGGDQFQLTSIEIETDSPPSP
jgi:hydrogenase nickel incorporation protein HypA/HybF